MSRITNSMLVSNYMNNMQRNLGNMSTVQNQLASGKNITKGSDNPYGAVKSMQLNAEISANKQYNTNISDTSNWLDTTDTALGQANNVIKRIKELMIKAGNGTYGPNEINAVKDELTEKVNEFGQILNTSFDGSFIFGGTKGTSKPVNVSNGQISYAFKDGTDMKNTVSNNATSSFPVTSVINNSNDAQKRISELKSLTPVPTGTDATAMTDEIAKLQPFLQINTKLKTEISDGVVVDYNKTAVDVLEFKDSNGNNINVTTQLSDIIKCLDVGAGGTSKTLSNENGLTLISNKQDAVKALGGKLLDNIQSISINLLGLRSGVGAMQNRMDSAKTNNEDQSYNMTSILSETEDIDFTEKTMEYSVMQTVYTATLQTSSKVLAKTLLDYI